MDEYHSKVSDGKLYYRPPSAYDLVGRRLDMDALKSFDHINTHIEVDSGDDTLVCGSRMADCTVKYSWWQTPIWYYLSPPTMYHGADVALAFSPKGAQDYKRSD